MSLPSSLLRALKQAQTVGVITGAGVSAESGIQTYRGRGGLYDRDETMESLTTATLERDPDRTWRTVSALAVQIASAQPNRAHLAIAELEQHAERFALLTQNVDGLHQQAGSRNVIDIHGSIRSTRCMECAVVKEWSIEEIARFTTTPTCGQCSRGSGGMLRPDAVLFGELLPVEKTARLRREFYDEVPDVVIAVGTSALFPYIVDPLVTASGQGKCTVDINPESNPASRVASHHLQGNATDYLPAVVAAFVG